MVVGSPEVNARPQGAAIRLYRAHALLDDRAQLLWRIIAGDVGYVSVRLLKADLVTPQTFARLAGGGQLRRCAELLVTSQIIKCEPQLTVWHEVKGLKLCLAERTVGDRSSSLEGYKKYIADTAAGADFHQAISL